MAYTSITIDATVVHTGSLIALGGAITLIDPAISNQGACTNPRPPTCELLCRDVLSESRAWLTDAMHDIESLIIHTVTPGTLIGQVLMLP